MRCFSLFFLFGFNDLCCFLVYVVETLFLEVVNQFLEKIIPLINILSTEIALLEVGPFGLGLRNSNNVPFHTIYLFFAFALITIVHSCGFNS